MHSLLGDKEQMVKQKIEKQRNVIRFELIVKLVINQSNKKTILFFVLFCF